jgi:hypothetical protein
MWCGSVEMPANGEVFQIKSSAEVREKLRDFYRI